MSTLNLVRGGRYIVAAILFAGVILLGTSLQVAGKEPAQSEPKPFQLTTTSLPDTTVGADYKTTIYATGGKFPYEFSGTGFPPGLAFGYASDTILGKATTAGSYDVVITAKDGGKPQQQTATLKTKILVK